VKRHKVEQWLNARPDDPKKFVGEVAAVGDLYKQAKELHKQGTHLISTDEKTGIQALARAADNLPMKPGLVEGQEYEYVRHGTQCLIANFAVATGQVVAPSLGASRRKRISRHISLRRSRSIQRQHGFSSLTNATHTNLQRWSNWWPENVGLSMSWAKKVNQGC
jgi:hypothetical protein